VWRLCSEMSIFSAFTKKGKRARSRCARHDDLVQRDFSASRMNELWFTDITEHATTSDGSSTWPRLKTLLGRIVGYSIGPRMTRHLACAALRNAIALRDHQGTICHSDRGSQFRSRDFVLMLKNNGLVGSMGRVGAAVTTRAWNRSTRCCRTTCSTPRSGNARELRVAIVTWIERTYHRRRRKRSLGRMTPVEFEAVFQVVDEEDVAA